MAVKIRLMRIGAKKRPFYRVVAVDERRKRTGAYIELLGTYNPLTEPHEIILKKDRIDYWIKNGAQLSHGYLRITKQAPQKPPRKPKKSQVEGAPKEIKEEKIEEKVEEVKEEEKTEEAPVETNEQPTTDQEKK
ncbi:30S ribosomal protein S16 [Candidatus Daviesbacteria bacterium RIFOXYD1_FULL_41_10]|uniref:Small ribosomal subunit protein bS16 n=1 Tax=Candidatus Daviesbacteria bacterium RIFOXYD1_FULL_41_10 TaxID=1797801 RepID=A0A1F5N2T6_9BACT|nr:MAG: 30S ribosomal protein S16 [Candidatus Daviesbacteria bacterium RIFOXYD1_FULL_41_10]